MGKGLLGNPCAYAPRGMIEFMPKHTALVCQDQFLPSGLALYGSHLNIHNATEGFIALLREAAKVLVGDQYAPGPIGSLRP